MPRDVSLSFPATRAGAPQTAHPRDRRDPDAVYRRITVLLRREGWHVNVKRVHRLYRLEGMQMRLKPPRRRVMAKLQRYIRILMWWNDPFEGGLRLQKICRASAWLLALAIVVLSLVPPSYRPITGASHNCEHLAIFLMTGFAFGLAYPDKPFALAVGLVIFCTAIEISQRWIPGRHARLSDFIVDAAAACIGLGAASVAARFSGYRRRH